MKLKYNLSHIRDSDLHYRLVKTVWGSLALGHSCTYYWIKLPISLLLWAIGGGFVGVILLLITIALGFCGFVVTLFPSTAPELKGYTTRTHLAYPYGTLPNGKKLPVVPWQIALVLAALWALYYLVFQDPALGLIVESSVLMGAIGLAIGATAVFFLTKGIKSEPIQQARKDFAGVFDRICPPLVIAKAKK